MFEELVCPISNVIINRNVVRTNGFITTLLLVAYVVTGSALIIVPVGLDYVVRTMMHGPTSPMTHLAGAVAKALGLPYRAMDKAPKVFASRIGVCFAMGAAITHFVAPAAAPWLAGTLAVFTALESIGDLCVGCVVYSYVFLPMFKARDAVKSIPLFRQLEDGMLIAVASGFRTVQVPQGTRLITEGEPGNALFFLLSGKVEVFHESPSGVQVVATRERGSVFGEMSLVDGQPRAASVRAAVPSVVMQLAKVDFDALIARHPRMLEILQRTASERKADEGALAAV